MTAKAGVGAAMPGPAAAMPSAPSVRTVCTQAGEASPAFAWIAAEPSRPTGTDRPGLIESGRIEIVTGGTTVRLSGKADAADLAAVLDAVRRRS